MLSAYQLPGSRIQDEEYFLTYRFPIARDHHGTSCSTSLPVGCRFGIRKIKMCSHEEGPCVDAFDPQNATHAVGAPFHLLCLEMFAASACITMVHRVGWALRDGHREELRWLQKR